jgi:hypothetical protein
MIKMLCEENYIVVIIIKFLLHQSIVPQMFLVDALLNTRHLLELYRLIHIMFFSLWKEVVVLIS